MTKMTKIIEIKRLEGDLISRCARITAEIKALQEQEKALKEEIQQLAGISEGSIRLQDENGSEATVSMARRTTWDQEALNEILERHPRIAAEYFKREWKPVDQEMIDRRISATMSKVWTSVAEAMKKTVNPTIRLKGGK